jgi:hypothetical protein
MAGKMQQISIPCRGGLNLSSNNHELLGKPGEAIDLVNFEVSKEGGYRRINGYEALSTAEVTGAGNVVGVVNYQGLIACRGDNVYHSSDNATWTQVNTAARSGNTRYMFARHYYASKEYIYMTDGVNAPAVFSIDDQSVSRFAELGDDSGTGNALLGAKYCTFYKDQLILGGMTDHPTSIFYSSLAATDLNSPEDDDKETPQENFNGATAGSLDFGDIVTGIKSHRETLYVFCRTSIFKVVGIESGQLQSTPVTRDIGCVDGFSIQEIGGDLVFLAPDGLRTIAKTERLEDIEMGTISRKISPLISPRVRDVERYWFVSTVIREKNQYRLWFIDPLNTVAAQRGITATFSFIDDQQGFEWAFSELVGYGVLSVDNGYHEGKERIIHGSQESGHVYVQEVGNTFAGESIDYTCQLAFSDYGDISQRKCVHKAILSSRAEGNVEAGLEVRYDYNHRDVFQPAVYPLERMTLPAIFGKPDSTFGDPIVFFGATNFGDTELYTEGSGFVVSLRIRPLKTIQDAPFDLQSFQIDLTAGGKI